MGAAVRSRRPKAVDMVLRAHIVTTASLAKAIDVTLQAAWATAPIDRSGDRAGSYRQASLHIDALV